MCPLLPTLFLLSSLPVRQPSDLCLFSFFSFLFFLDRAVDQMRAEIGRMLKQEDGKTIQPVSFIVPRKNQDIFQADLYPPSPDIEPTMTSADWLAGKTLPLRRRAVKPGDVIVSSHNRRMTIDPAMTGGGGGGGTPPTGGAAAGGGGGADPKEVQRLQSEVESLKAQAAEADKLRRENENLRAKVQKLQSELAEASASSSSASGSSDPALSQKLSALEEELSNERARNAQQEGKLRDLESRFISAKKGENAAVERYKDLEVKYRELKSQMEQAQGTLYRAATLSGLDADMKHELNEMRDFFRDILQHSDEEGE
ncbi:coronin [Cystoisospora suis]|uniref:Coronin n=1 Tax=Cystoisospora suis TaxID=483139 RepID=A0A2C6KGG3_9APIC|nr:coronin [Cystoisospora suis]